MRRLLFPWVLWVMVYCSVMIGGHALNHSVLPQFSDLASVAHAALFRTAYWFVPNMALALAIILVFARHVNSWRFGAIGLCAALFYGINIYFSWIPSLHLTAAFGFVGYLWLGAWSARNWRRVHAVLARCPAWCLAIIVVAAWLLSIAEADLLRSRDYIDPLNTLRVSNQIFSVAVVALLVKFPRPISPKFINVRKHTFGLYLTHTVILVPISWLALRYAAYTKAAAGWCYLGTGVLLYVLTYWGSTVLTVLLASQPGLCWAVGARIAPQPAVNRDCLLS